MMAGLAIWACATRRLAVDQCEECRVVASIHRTAGGIMCRFECRIHGSMLDCFQSRRSTHASGFGPQFQEEYLRPGPTAPKCVLQLLEDGMWRSLKLSF